MFTGWEVRPERAHLLDEEVRARRDQRHQATRHIVIITHTHDEFKSRDYLLRHCERNPG
jgi:hypothetical protein